MNTDKTAINDQFHSLLFISSTQNLYVFFAFLQNGFYSKVQTGQSIKEMLCHQFGIDPDYAVNRIKTIFYDGKPVDDMETAIVRNGARLAFSAAMPGLVGATFRSSGLLSPFRSSISYRQDPVCGSESKDGLIFIKLFNLLVPETGPIFLKNGILIEKKTIDTFVKDQNSEFISRFQSVFFDDYPIDTKKLIQDGVPGNTKYILLKVKTS